MRLAVKLTIVLILGICGVTFVFTYAQVHRETGLFEQELAKDQRILGKTLRDALTQAGTRLGPDAAAALLQSADATGEGVRFRVVSLDPQAPHDRRPAVPLTSLHLLGAGETITLTASDVDGAQRRYTYVSLESPGQTPGALEVSESLANEHSYLRLTKWQAVYAAFANILVSSLLALGAGFWIVGAPVRGLVQQARRIGAGDLSHRIDAVHHDELGVLSREFNAMCDRLADARLRLTAETEARIATVEQLRHADRLATVGKLASGVAHEIGTPLNVIGVRARLLLTQQHPPAELAVHARSIVDQTERITSIVRQLLDFSRRRGAVLRTLDLQALVAHVVTMLEPLARKRQIQFDVHASSQPVNADQSQLQQVLTNIVVNGIHAMPRGGTVRIDLDAAPATPPADHPDAGSNSSWVRLAVADAGCGIAPEHMPLVFEPFFTTKDVGDGTGLGLSVAYGIVREHGGWIDVSSTVGAGSRFTVHLPLATHTALSEGHPA